MKKMITLAAVAIMIAGCKPAQAQQSSEHQTEQTTIESYEGKLEAINKEAEKIIEDYRVLSQKEADNETEEGEARLESLLTDLNTLQSEQVRLIVSMAQENRNRKEPAAYIAEAFYAMSYDQLKTVLVPTAAYYNEEAMEQVKEHFASMQLRAPGTMFKDLEEADTNGKLHKLSEYVGKGNYVLVDFWASWCGPCREEMPNVVKAYNEYHSKGFNVVGLSFDNKKEAWLQAISDLHMPWTHLSDLKGWKTEASKVYGIRSIPSNLLVDPQGKIVDIDLRGAALLSKLAEIYGE